VKRLERTAEIAAPATELFDLVSDPAQLPGWQSGNHLGTPDLARADQGGLGGARGA